MPKYGESIESQTTMADGFDSTGGTVVLKGWDIAPAKQFITEAIEELLDYPDEIFIDITERKEIAYSCARYEMGEDARDEGFSYWINYHKKWKKGLGKCSVYKIKIVAVSKDG